MKYDLIVSNPPYFQQDLRAPDSIRSQARHAHTLTQEDLADSVVRLLNEAGRFAVIFPTDQAIAFETIVRKYDLFAIRKLFVQPTPSSPVRRVSAEYSFQSAPSSIEELVIESEGRHGYSEQYRALTRDFYLKF